MIKKRSPKKIIESTPNPKVEHAYVKFPGRNLIEVSLHHNTRFVEFDLDKIKKLAGEYGIQKYTELHTHTTGDSIPSGQDIRSFLKTPNAKTMVVVSQDPDSGNIEGYYFLRKRTRDSQKYTELKANQLEEKKKYDEIQARNEEGWRNYELRAQKRNSSWTTRILAKLGIDLSLKSISEEDKEHIRKWDRFHFRNLPNEDSNNQIKEDVENYERNMMSHRMDYGMQELATRYNLQYRFIPEKEYAFNGDWSLRFKKKGLEKKLAVASLISLIGSLFFISSGITGNAILNLPIKTTPFLGAVLLIVGLVAGFFWFRSRKR